MLGKLNDHESFLIDHNGGMIIQLAINIIKPYLFSITMSGWSLIII